MATCEFSRYLWAMADSSFDVVSKIDRMELDNALNQASREVATRFDFKNALLNIKHLLAD
jgi:uncharacterized protein YajQ (UPF0234 family)